MDNDSISRSALKETLHNFFDGQIIENPVYVLRDVFCYIDNAPTVDLLIARGTNGVVIPVTRPQGEWIMESKLCDGFGDSVLAITCSICKESFIYRGKTHNFCSNCGADMRATRK